MSRKLFGTDGIRGVAGQYPLDPAGARQIGKAVGTYFAEPGDQVLVGHDPRESSLMLKENLVAGLNAVGVDGVLVGIIPTPGLAYVTKQSGAKAGVMITASHNPYTDNGIKVFTHNGGKLSDEIEAELNELIESSIPENGYGQCSEDLIAITNYENFLVSSAGDARFEGFRVGIDTANGATSGVAARVFERLGARVTPLSDKPDGRNINVACGATNTKALQRVVKNQALQAGIALDGDGDRLMIIDEKGRQLDGDYLLYILAISGKHKNIVATVMSNIGLETALKKHSIGLTRVAVGDRYVLEGLEQTGYELGGEKSGHIVLPAYATTGDGLLAAIQTIKTVFSSGKRLSEWYDELTLLPQELTSIPLKDKEALNHPDIQAIILAQTAELKGHGRLNIRPSGTEPILRIMVEAPDALERAHRIADKIGTALERGESTA